MRWLILELGLLMKLCVFSVAQAAQGAPIFMLFQDSSCQWAGIRMPWFRKGRLAGQARGRRWSWNRAFCPILRAICSPHRMQQKPVRCQP